MNTRSMQLTRRLNQVLGDFIKSGVFPSTGQLMNKTIYSFPNQYVVGSPSCVPEEVGYNVVTDPDQYNNFFTRAVDDMQLLYDMIVDQLRALVTDMDYQMVLRSRTKSRIKQLEADINAICEQPPYIYREEFANMCNLNIHNTTAYINSNENIATLPENHMMSKRIYPDIEYISQTGTLKTINGISNMFDDSLNSMWLSSYNASKDEKHSISQTITFKSAIKFNKIVMIGFSPKPINVQITLNTSDSAVNLESKPCDTYQTASWYFDTVSVLSFTITLSKNNADYLDSSNQSPYTYIYGVQSMEFYNTHYIDQAVIESNMINIKDLTNKTQSVINLKLTCRENVPSGCSTSYYVCVTDASEPDNWLRITPGSQIIMQKPYTLSYYMSEATPYVFSSDRSIQAYTLTGESAGVPQNAYNLTLARNYMWTIQYYYYDVQEDNLELYSDSNPTLDDFASQRGNSSDMYITWYTFGDAKVLPSAQGNKKRMVMFTTYITSDTNKIVTLPSMSMWWGDSSRVNLYVNDTQVDFSYETGTINNGFRNIGVIHKLNLIQGINKLNIVTNDYYANDLFDLNTALAGLGITLTNSKCEEYPLTQVSMYDLLYNTRVGDVSRYAIDHDGMILITNSQNSNFTMSRSRYLDAGHNIFYKVILQRDKLTSDINTPQIDNLSIIINS